jgi:hypothetical protein
VDDVLCDDSDEMGGGVERGGRYEAKLKCADNRVCLFVPF